MLGRLGDIISSTLVVVSPPSQSHQSLPTPGWCCTAAGMAGRENGECGGSSDGSWKKRVDDIKSIFDFKEVLGT